MSSLRTRCLVVPVVAAVVSGLVALTPSTAAAGAPARPDEPRVEADPLLDEPLPGRAALRALGDRIDDAARLNGMSTARLERLLGEDPSAWLSANAHLYYVDAAPTAAPDAAPVARGPYPYDQTLLLHSKPGSQRTIFLDFDGANVSGTEWNTAEYGGLANGNHPAWDPAGNGVAFSNPERDLVQSIWQRVAEDYAPFDVDVTTQEPSTAAITRSGAGDEVFGTRALITPSASALLAICDDQCGGVAFVDVFDEPSFHANLQPAWIFPQKLSNNAKLVAEAVSHEVGHNMGLEHDGQGTGPGSVDYYAGHGSWAPIMGDSYQRPISQWSAGSYSAANQTQDDVAVIGSSVHAFRADEAVGVVTGAPGLPSAGASGFITSRTDVDVWDLGTCAGSVALTADPAPVSPNLDIRLRLLTAVGAEQAASNPASAADGYDSASGMSAAISTSVGSGHYYAEIDGVGNGNAATGYDDYGSLGAYTLTQSGCTGATTLSAPGAPTSVAGSRDVAAGTATLTWDVPASTGGTAVTGYEVAVDGGGWVTKAASDRSHTFTGLTGTSHTLAVRARNSVDAGPAAQIVVTSATAPGAVQNLRNVFSGTTANLAWNAPATNGGSAVSYYEVDFLGETTDIVGTSAYIVGLERDVTYTVTVRAVNAIGAGPGSTISFRLPPLATVPAAPRIGAAAHGAPRGAVTASVRWTAPANGGAAITGYQVFAYQLNRSGRVVRTFSTGVLRPTLRRAEVRLPAARYRFAVRARNSVGWGRLSARSGIATAR